MDAATAVNHLLVATIQSFKDVFEDDTLKLVAEMVLSMTVPPEDEETGAEQPGWAFRNGASLKKIQWLKAPMGNLRSTRT